MTSYKAPEDLSVKELYYMQDSIKTQYTMPQESDKSMYDHVVRELKDHCHTKMKERDVYKLIDCLTIKIT